MPWLLHYREWGMTIMLVKSQGKRVLLGVFIVVMFCIYFSFRLWRVGPQQKAKVMTFSYVPRPRTEIVRVSELERLALASYALPRVLDELGPTDLQETSRRARLLAQTHPIPIRPIRGELSRMLERQLYGYALDKYGSITSIAQSYFGGGRGIVITTGDLYYRFAVHVIRSLRMMGCSLPVEVWYNGRTDLNSTNAHFIDSFYKVNVRNIQDHFSVSMETWDIKPFAVLASSFEEVILMDADSVFLKNPIELFDDPDYIKHGALFFKDRSLFPGQGDKSNWILSLFPEPHSIRVQNLRILQAKSQYELESGVVLMNKRRHFYGMLAVCKLNCPGPLKNMIREETHGEKETFWIGLEILDEPYAFMPQLPGSLGTVTFNEGDKVEELCGKLAHFDRNGRLLWFNDAIAASKLPGDFFMSELMDLTHFARESEGEWESLCLRGGPFHKLEPEQLTLIERLKQIYKFNPVDQNLKPKDPSSGGGENPQENNNPM